MGLVLRDKNQAIDDFIKKTWVMKDPKKRKIDETPEFWKGLADGAKVDIGDPRRRIK